MCITINLFSNNAVLKSTAVLAMFYNISPTSAFKIKNKGETNPRNKPKGNKDCVYPIDC